MSFTEALFFITLYIIHSPSVHHLFQIKQRSKSSIQIPKVAIKYYDERILKRLITTKMMALVNTDTDSGRMNAASCLVVSTYLQFRRCRRKTGESTSLM